MLTCNVKAATLYEKIGQMIMVGFDGATPDNKDVKAVGRQIKQGSIGGVIFFKYNIKSPDQIKELTQFFSRQSSVGHPILLAIDQEGGKVQRLNASNGFKDYLSAWDVAQNYTPAEAEVYYQDMAKMVSDSGFNMNFGPVVDLHTEAVIGKTDSVISGFKRSYSSLPQEVTAYATAFVNAHHKHHVLTSLKHFPGHGYATKDSHKGMVDITNTHAAIEFMPFFEMIKSGKADMIMTAHLVNTAWDKQHPASLSHVILNQRLRREMNFDGVIVSDDLHMGAIGQHYTLKETVIKAIQAGCDILLFSNNQAAAQNVSESKIHSNIALMIMDIVQTAIQNNELTVQQIETSYQRIKKLKEKLNKD